MLQIYTSLASSGGKLAESKVIIGGGTLSPYSKFIECQEIKNVNEENGKSIK
mgnify:FL=1